MNWIYKLSGQIWLLVSEETEECLDGFSKVTFKVTALIEAGEFGMYDLYSTNGDLLQQNSSKEFLMGYAEHMVSSWPTPQLV